MEVEALSRRIELLKEEQSHNKEDVDKFTSDLALKVIKICWIYQSYQILLYYGRVIGRDIGSPYIKSDYRVLLLSWKSIS